MESDIKAVTHLSFLYLVLYPSKSVSFLHAGCVRDEKKQMVVYNQLYMAAWCWPRPISFTNLSSSTPLEFLPQFNAADGICGKWLDVVDSKMITYVYNVVCRLFV